MLRLPVSSNSSVGYHITICNTGVSTKVFPQSVRAYATMPIGIIGSKSLALLD